MLRHNINEEEKSIFKSLIHFFETHKFSDMDKEIDGILEETINVVFQLEMKRLNIRYNSDKAYFKNDVIMRIINDCKKNIRGSEKNGKKLEYDSKTIFRKRPRITYNKANLYTNLSDKDTKKRVLACKKIFITIFHEIEHMIQHKLVEQSVSSKNTLMCARDFALKELMGDYFYKGENYIFFAIEVLARKDALERYLEIMGEPEPEIEYMKDLEEGILCFGKYKYNLELAKRDKVAIKLLDKIIYEQDRLDILEKYPALYKEYTVEGKRKNAFQLIYNMVKEEKEIQSKEGISKEEKEMLLNDSREMYYELIYIQLEKISESDFLEFSRTLDELGMSNIFIQMIQYMEKEENRKTKIANKMIKACQYLNIDINKTTEGLEKRVRDEYGTKKELLQKLENMRNANRKEER